MADSNSITTLARRTALAQLTAGIIGTVPRITHMAFGDGGVDENGNPAQPAVNQGQLHNEFCRYPAELIDSGESTTSRYRVVIPKDEQTGEKFNEVSLVDEAGIHCCIKTMYTKQKDVKVEFTFTFDDEF